MIFEYISMKSMDVDAETGEVTFTVMYGKKPTMFVVDETDVDETDETAVDETDDVGINEEADIDYTELKEDEEYDVKENVDTIDDSVEGMSYSMKKNYNVQPGEKITLDIKYKHLNDKSDATALYYKKLKQAEEYIQKKFSVKKHSVAKDVYQFVVQHLDPKGHPNPIWNYIENKFLIVSAFDLAIQRYKQYTDKHQTTEIEKLAILFVCLRSYSSKTFKFLMSMFIQEFLANDTDRAEFFRVLDIIVHREFRVKTISDFMTTPMIFFATDARRTFLSLLNVLTVLNVTTFMYMMIHYYVMYTDMSLESAFQYVFDFYSIPYSFDVEIQKYNKILN